MKARREQGEKHLTPCDHPHLEKEYYVGAYLVNWVCTSCGREFTIAQKLELEQSRKVSYINGHEATGHY